MPEDPNAADDTARDSGTPDDAPVLLSGHAVAALYDELRRLAASLLAAERGPVSIQATELAHEAFLRLGGERNFKNRRHFFAAAALAMRRALVDRARHRQRLRRGGGAAVQALDAVPTPAAPDQGPPALAVFADDDLIRLHRSLSELTAESPRAAEVVQLRLFLGLNADQAANVIGISVPTVVRDHRFALAWLRAKLREPTAEAPTEDRAPPTGT